MFARWASVRLAGSGVRLMPGRVARYPRMGHPLTVLEAGAAGRWVPVVYYPLGLERARVKTYTAVKLSAFVFRTPRQQEAWRRALSKFGQRTGCGQDLLALRRNHLDRPHGSLAAVAKQIHRAIRGGDRNPARTLHLTGTDSPLLADGETYSGELAASKASTFGRLVGVIAQADMNDEGSRTGWFVSTADLVRNA